MIEKNEKEFISLATRIKEFIFDHLESTHGIHAETAICISIGLAGRFTLRQNYRGDLSTLRPNQPIFIDSVSTALETKIQELLTCAEALGINPNPESGWLGEKSPKTTPLKPITNLCDEFEPLISEILSRSTTLSYELWSQIMTYVSIQITLDVSSVISEGEAKKLLLSALMEGAKMVPGFIPPTTY